MVTDLILKLSNWRLSK